MVDHNPTKPVAPVAQIQFKVIEYGAVNYTKTGHNNNLFGSSDNTRETIGSSIHYDLMD